MNWDFVDGSTLLSSLSEIYLDECYRFNSDTKSPLIIDCGSNIGFPVCYFKRLYAGSRIIVFEADKSIYEVLKNNIEKAGLTNVKLLNKAVWTSDEILEFRHEEGLSGRARINNEMGTIYHVEGARLKSFLHEKVDFFKIDIEGAEYAVIKDCSDLLRNVKLIYLEYHSPLGDDQKLSEILEILRFSGFRIYLKEAFLPKNPFVEITSLDGMDLQLNIYSIRNS